MGRSDHRKNGTEAFTNASKGSTGFLAFDKGQKHVAISSSSAGKKSALTCFWRARFLARWFPSPTRYRRWVELAFEDFVVDAKDASREQFHAELLEILPPLIDGFDALQNRSEETEKWLGQLLIASDQIAKLAVGHRECRLLSYNDVFLQMASLRVLIEHFSVLRHSRWTDALTLSRVLVEKNPASRVVLILLGQDELRKGNVDSALEAARRALAVQTDCPRAQRLLFEVYTEKTKIDPTLRQNEISLVDQKGRFCSAPFKTLVTVEGGPGSIAFLCGCGGWLPYSAGDILRAENVDSVWNSDAAMEMRRSILDGDFSYCSRTLCPLLVADSLPTREDVTDPLMRRYIDENLTRLPEAPQQVQLSHDATCNLACPTCRKEVLTANAATRDRLADVRERVILPLLSRMRGEVFVTGWGDPFASKHYRSILERLNPVDFPNLSVVILTNGQLLNRAQWEKMGAMHSMISEVKVSMDAASATTYENVRRPGRWEPLIKNIEFLSQIRKEGQLKKLGLQFVVQKANFREIPEFVRLGREWGVDMILFQKLWNFGAQSQADFIEADVASPTHPFYSELLQILSAPVMKEKHVNAYNLVQVFEDAG